MKRDTFSGFHPAINLLYFVLVIGFAMTLQHPVCQAISLLSGFAWSCALTGGKGGKKLGWLAAMFALTALVNPLFSHAGATILCYLPSGNPLTLESLLYGLCAAATLACALVWFSCLNAVMGSDKIFYLFGRVIPALSLLLSMTLRFVPRFAAQVKKVARAARTGPRRLRGQRACAHPLCGGNFVGRGDVGAGERHRHGRFDEKPRLRPSRPDGVFHLPL